MATKIGDFDLFFYGVNYLEALSKSTAIHYTFLFLALAVNLNDEHVMISISGSYKRNMIHTIKLLQFPGLKLFLSLTVIETQYRK